MTALPNGNQWLRDLGDLARGPAAGNAAIAAGMAIGLAVANQMAAAKPNAGAAGGNNGIINNGSTDGETATAQVTKHAEYDPSLYNKFGLEKYSPDYQDKSNRKRSNKWYDWASPLIVGKATARIVGMGWYWIADRLKANGFGGAANVAEALGNIAGMGEGLIDNLNPMPWGIGRRLQTMAGLAQRGAGMFDTAHRGGYNIVESGTLAGLGLVADTVGVTSISDAAAGRELLSQERLSGSQRVTLGITGVAQLVGTAVTIYQGAGLAAGRLMKPGVPESPTAPQAGRNLSCFPAGTLVSTEGGRKPIERIVCGDQVWAFDFQNSCWRLCPVRETYERVFDGPIVAITIGAEEITATDCHPFWVVRGEALAQRPEPDHAPATEFGSRQEGRWVVARDLRVGDELLLHTGETMAIEKLAVSQRRLTVYNLCVAWLKNYAVGASEVLAHNSNGPASILMPNGQPIGVAGSKAVIRELPGGIAAAQDMFGRLSQGGTPHMPPGYKGTAGTQLPGGGWVGFRPKVPPTIDVNIPGIPIKKLKFL